MKKRHKKFIFLILIIISLFFIFKEKSFVKLLLDEQKKIILLIEDFFVFSCLFYFLIYVFFISISVPIGFFLTFFSGYLFGFYFGSIISIFGATIGSYIIFNLIKYNFKQTNDSIKKYSYFYQKINFEINKNNYKYLFFIRVFPLMPFWLANILPPLVGVRDIPFLITTFFGIMPMTFLIAFSGSNLAFFDIKDLDNFNFENFKYLWGVLFLLSILIILSLIKRFFLKTK